MAKEKIVTIKADTPISKQDDLSCIGEICFREGKIEIDITKADCPPEVVEQLVKSTLKGLPVEFVISKEKVETTPLKKFLTMNE